MIVEDGDARLVQSFFFNFQVIRLGIIVPGLGLVDPEFHVIWLGLIEPGEGLQEIIRLSINLDLLKWMPDTHPPVEDQSQT